MKIHDYTKTYWGHDYTFEPIDMGMKGSMVGWGHGIKKGDYLLLKNGDSATRYKVMKIKYYLDPKDMWTSEVKFAPRTRKELVDTQ